VTPSTQGESIVDVPYARNQWPNYENFVAECPHCGHVNVFNPRSDLRDCNPIDFREVTCQQEECRRPFNINCDLVGPPHEYMVFDCYELLKQKRYMSCILNLTQAYETFFGLCLRVELLWRPFFIEGNDDLEQANTTEKTPFDEARRFAFCRLRKVFFSRILEAPPVTSLTEAQEVIPTLSGVRSDPTDSLIAGVGDPSLRELLLGLKRVDVHAVRNKVVHARAYRPSVDEVNKHLQEARSTLLPLASRLGIVTDEIEWYRDHEAPLKAASCRRTPTG